MARISTNINIRNKRASFEFELLEQFTAGVVLYGSEIKSLRASKGRITESFCQVKDDGIHIINMYIDEYSNSISYAHQPRRERKLLLQKREIHKITRALNEKGLTLVPLRVFINERGLAKVVIALARGKKLYDKRESIKDKDTKRDLERAMKT